MKHTKKRLAHCRKITQKETEIRRDLIVLKTFRIQLKNPQAENLAAQAGRDLRYLVRFAKKGGPQ